MREIKFRQPLFIKGKFSRFHYWGFISKGNFSSPINDWVDGEASQQYTGLNDKNGVEIYEGDIVKYLNEPLNSEVIYHSETCAFLCRDKENIIWSICKENLHKIEVIGNIHKNPELLTP